MKRILFLALFIYSVNLFSQTKTLSLTSGKGAGQDAFLASRDVNTNYGNHPELSALTGTCSGDPCSARGLLKFDLSSIPSNATIISAKLNLWANPKPLNQGNVAMVGNNASLIQLVTASWGETSVTWGNQPSTTTTNQITLAKTTSSTQNQLNLDVKALISEMIKSSNYGMLIKMVDETPGNGMIFASSDYSDTAVHPRLTVTYTTSASKCFSISSGKGSGQDAFLASRDVSTNYGNHPELSALTGTCSGSPCSARGLLKFDLSALPTGATNVTGTLDLWANPKPLNQGNVAMVGTNASTISRVTTSWTESGVTWGNQPSTTTTNQIALSTTTSSTQNQLGIDISSMLNDMIKSGNYGMLVKMNDETPGSGMIFASSDYSDTTVHPRLKVCYNSSSEIRNIIKKNSTFISPNPAKSVITVTNSENNEIGTFKIYSVEGKLILQETMLNRSKEINIQGLSSSVYYCVLELNNSILIQKLVIVN